MNELVLAEWQRAGQSLRAAQVCLRHAFYEDSISRAYYAILHAAKAVLQLHGIAAESHAGVKRLFGQHLVLTGLLEAEWGTTLGRSSDLRLVSDYDVETQLSEADAREACDRAGAFLTRMRTLLLARGLTDNALGTEASNA
jgi:uncharacterized protein (UPF0332 family)